MIQPQPPRPQPPASPPRGAPGLPVRLLAWLWPSIVLGFAVPGFFVLQTPLSPTGDFVVNASAMASLQSMGWSALVLSVIGRAVLWPPPALRRFVRRHI